MCYKEIFIGSKEVMSCDFVENYDAQKAPRSDVQIQSASTKEEQEDEENGGADPIYWGDHISLKDDQVAPFSVNLSKFRFQPGLQGIWLEMQYANGQ